MIDLVGVAWAWSTLSELLAYSNSSKFPLGQRDLDNRGWTVIAVIIVIGKIAMVALSPSQLQYFNIAYWNGFSACIIEKLK